MAKTIEQIQEEVQQIKNETVAKQNTATRVGGALEDMVEKMEADSISVEGKLTNLGSKVGELKNLQTTDKTNVVNAINEALTKGGIPDAPSDGKQYVRQNNAWAENKPAVDAYSKTESDTRFASKSIESDVASIKGGDKDVITLFGNASNNFVNSSGIWSAGVTSGTTTEWFNIVNAEKVKVTIPQSAKAACMVVILRAIPSTVGSSVSFATGYTSRATIQAGQNQTFALSGNSVFIGVRADTDNLNEPTSVIVTYKSDFVQKDDFNTVADKVDDISKNLEEVVTIEGYDAFAAKSGALVFNKDISADDGTEITNTSNGARTKYIDVEGATKIQSMMKGSTSDAVRHGLAFYDADKVFISGVLHPQTDSLVTIDNVPSNAKYVRCTWRSWVGSLSEGYKIIIYKGNRLNILEDSIKNNTLKINETTEYIFNEIKKSWK